MAEITATRHCSSLLFTDWKYDTLWIDISNNFLYILWMFRVQKTDFYLSSSENGCKKIRRWLLQDFPVGYWRNYSSLFLGKRREVGRMSNRFAHSLWLDNERRTRHRSNGKKGWNIADEASQLHRLFDEPGDLYNNCSAVKCLGTARQRALFALWRTRPVPSGYIPFCFPPTFALVEGTY